MEGHEACYRAEAGVRGLPSPLKTLKIPGTLQPYKLPPTLNPKASACEAARVIAGWLGCV